MPAAASGRRESASSFPLGTVTVGPYLLGRRRPADRASPRRLFPRSLSPGESVGAEVRIPTRELRRIRRSPDRPRPRGYRVVRGLRLAAARRSAPGRGLARVRVVVDVTPLALPRTGIGNYVLGMLRGLAEAGPEHEIVAFSAVAPPGKRRIETSARRRAGRAAARHRSAEVALLADSLEPARTRPGRVAGGTARRLPLLRLDVPAPAWRRSRDDDP